MSPQPAASPSPCENLRTFEAFCNSGRNEKVFKLAVGCGSPAAPLHHFHIKVSRGFFGASAEYYLLQYHMAGDGVSIAGCHETVFVRFRFHAFQLHWSSFLRRQQSRAIFTTFLLSIAFCCLPFLKTFTAAGMCLQQQDIQKPTVFTEGFLGLNSEYLVVPGHHTDLNPTSLVKLHSAATVKENFHVYCKKNRKTLVMSCTETI